MGPFFLCQNILSWHLFAITRNLIYQRIHYPIECETEITNAWVPSICAPNTCTNTNAMRNVWRDIMYALAIKCVNGDASAFGSAYRTIGDDLYRWIAKKKKRRVKWHRRSAIWSQYCFGVRRCLSCRVVAMRIVKSTFGSYDLRSCLRCHLNAPKHGIFLGGWILSFFFCGEFHALHEPHK